jgi:hypothetical protein
MYGSEAVHYSHPNNVTLPLFEPDHEVLIMFDVIYVLVYK